MGISSKLVIVDLECTCWELPPPDAVSEIIELGVCVFDGMSGVIGRKSSLLVRPNNLDISSYCTALTGITRERLVREGRPLGEVLNRVRKLYPVRSSAWGGWGCGDRDCISRESASKGADNPFLGTYVDVGLLYRFHARSPRRVGLSDALAALGMAFEGRPHCGADDAWNAARVLRRLLGW